MNDAGMDTLKEGWALPALTMVTCNAVGVDDDDVEAHDMAVEREWRGYRSLMRLVKAR